MKKNTKSTKKEQELFQDVEMESKFNLFEVIIIILISVIFGVIIGYLLTYGNSTLSRVRTDSNLNEVVNTYTNIWDNYYGNIEKKDLAEAAIKGMINSLDDPYSVYLDEYTTETFNSTVEGYYVGIGVVFSFDDDHNQILSVNENGPAEKAGIQKDDIILRVNGINCYDMLPKELYQLLSGEVGTKVDVDVLRGDEELSFTVTRKQVETQDVVGEILKVGDQRFGYIKISIFSSNSYNQFQKILNTLEKKEMDGLVIDVRDNPGGHLAQANKILNLFFKKNTVLYQTETRNKKEKVYSKEDNPKKYPIAVLINQDTASSAEVLAACFQENYKKVHVVGVTSYGKGNVQKSLSLSGGASIRFTIEKWLTPKGNDVSDKGVVPDITVEQDPNYYEEQTYESDVVLQKALESIKES